MRGPDGFLQRLAAHPEGDPDPMLPSIAKAQEAFRWMERAPFLVIAAVTGSPSAPAASSPSRAMYASSRTRHGSRCARCGTD
ncbi:hypothetical protein ACFYM3_34265 [Streptomyces massasporeus]|uniref:Uncharacterized protein n=1 Tax=Streptomyces massasporeus TaxID=67324 RepID=A0ABW6LN76_9ACTN